MTGLGPTPRVILPDPGCQVEQAFQCCAVEHPEDEPCRWRCTTCTGTGRCPECRGTGGEDDVVICDLCEGGGQCIDGCIDGWQVDELGGQPVITIRPAGGVL